jgi:hypothetical protein
MKSKASIFIQNQNSTIPSNQTNTDFKKGKKKKRLSLFVGLTLNS